MGSLNSVLLPFYTAAHGVHSAVQPQRLCYLPEEAPAGLFIDFGLLLHTMVGHLCSEVVGGGTVPAHGPGDRYSMK